VKKNAVQGTKIVKSNAKPLSQKESRQAMKEKVNRLKQQKASAGECACGC